MITVLAARGIGDPIESGMLSHVTTELDRDRFQTINLPYPAQYGPASGFRGVAFDASLISLWELVIEQLRAADPRSVALLGYSGGAAGIGDVVNWLISTNSELLDRILGVGLLADPRMPLSAAPNIGGASVPACGIAGSRLISTARFPVWWVSDPRDPIPCLELNSPLRPIADLTSAMSFVNVEAWLRNVAWRLRTKQVQEVFFNLRDPFAVIGQFQQALDALSRYLGTDHVSYPTRLYPGTARTYTQWLADRINEIEE